MAVFLFHLEQVCGVFVVGSWSSACGFLSLGAAPSSLSYALQALLAFSYTFFPSLTETLYDRTKILCLQIVKIHQMAQIYFMYLYPCACLSFRLGFKPTYPLQAKKVQNTKENACQQSEQKHCRYSKEIGIIMMTVQFSIVVYAK